MRTGALLALIALVVGAITGWFFKGHFEPDYSKPNVVDTALQNSPQVKAHLDSVLYIADSVARVSQATTLVIKDHKRVADSLNKVIVERHRALRVKTQPVTPHVVSSPGDTVIPTVIDTTEPDTAIFIADTWESCKADLNDRTLEARELRAALSPCEAAKAADEDQINTLHDIIAVQEAWRIDTFPMLIKKERNTPRPCIEKWLFVKVKCSVAGVIKFGAGVTTGVLITR